MLCIQEDSADHVLTMLRGAMRELSVGNPDRLSVDVGPVIDAEARNGIVRHIDAMRTAGRRVDQLELNGECRHGTFVPPTIIEIGHISELKREIFGPVLHVVRYKREELDALLEAVNGTGYGLTFGVHTRIDETIAHVTGQVHAGNVYVNRNIVGAVVGVQPFGGECRPAPAPPAARCTCTVCWARARRPAAGAGSGRALPQRIALPGPTGETNTYLVEPRGAVYCVAASEAARARNGRWPGRPATMPGSPIRRPPRRCCPGWMPSSRAGGHPGRCRRRPR